MFKIQDLYFVDTAPFNYVCDIVNYKNGIYNNRNLSINIAQNNKKEILITDKEEVFDAKTLIISTIDKDLDNDLNAILKESKAIIIDETEIIISIKAEYTSLFSDQNPAKNNDFQGQQYEETNNNRYYIFINNISYFTTHSESTVKIYFKNGEYSIFNISIEKFISLYEGVELSNLFLNQENQQNTRKKI